MVRPLIFFGSLGLGVLLGLAVKSICLLFGPDFPTGVRWAALSKTQRIHVQAFRASILGMSSMLWVSILHIIILALRTLNTAQTHKAQNPESPTTPLPPQATNHELRNPGAHMSSILFGDTMVPNKGARASAGLR